MSAQNHKARALSLLDKDSGGSNVERATVFALLAVAGQLGAIHSSLKGLHCEMNTLVAVLNPPKVPGAAK
jgi:hypothetical protein